MPAHDDSELKLRVGRCASNGAILEYRIELRGGYVALITSAATKWRLTIGGRSGRELGVFETARAAVVKLQGELMLAASRNTRGRAYLDMV